jgi:hypothetical protein
VRGSARHRLLIAWPRGLVRRGLTGGARLLGAGLLVAIGLVHLALAPQYYSAAAYVGVLFYLTCAAAWATALGVVAGVRGAWLAGGLIAAGALVALVASVTVGLPGFTDSLSAPWAALSLPLEGGFVGVYLVLALVRHTPLLDPPRY